VRFRSIDLEQYDKTDHEIIIYPDRHALHNREMENRMMTGGFTERNALFSDPLMTNGTRGYIPEDSMRDIHWKASAKTGELQTRLYDKMTDRKSTRLNSSHVSISYAVFCLKKKNIYEDAARAD